MPLRRAAPRVQSCIRGAPAFARTPSPSRNRRPPRRLHRAAVSCRQGGARQGGSRVDQALRNGLGLAWQERCPRPAGSAVQKSGAAVNKATKHRMRGTGTGVGKRETRTWLGARIAAVYRNRHTWSTRNQLVTWRRRQRPSPPAQGTRPCAAASRRSAGGGTPCSRTRWGCSAPVARAAAGAVCHACERGLEGREQRQARSASHTKGPTQPCACSGARLHDRPHAPIDVARERKHVCLGAQHVEARAVRRRGTGLGAEVVGEEQRL